MRLETGFSLIELLIVVAILGILSAIAMPNLSSADPEKLELAASEIAGAYRFARSEAVRTGEARGVHLDASAKRIRVYSHNTTTTPPTPVYDVRHPLSKQLYDLKLEDLPYMTITGMTDVPVFQGTCTSSGLIYFDAKGVAWCGDPANVVLRQENLTLSLGSQSKVINLNGITGRVTVL